jgi:hypothetical protein
MLQEIAFIIKELTGHEYLYFNDALTVKMHPHDHFEVSFWAVCVSRANQVFVMTADEQWHQVEERETALIQSLYQRVKLMDKQYKAAV